MPAPIPSSTFNEPLRSSELAQAVEHDLEVAQQPQRNVVITAQRTLQILRRTPTPQPRLGDAR
ncbi:MAG: hypothetical protein ACI8W7_002663 [Gammaproteobacteria bacterium]|jgi:hypothetical protein